MEHTDQAAAEQAGCGIFNLDGNLLDDQNNVIGEWTVTNPHEAWMKENKKRARKRPPPRPRLHWEDIPADVRKEMIAELATGFNNMKKYLDLPERAVVALERIADDLDFFREVSNIADGENHNVEKKRGEGDKKDSEGTGRPDPGNTIEQSDGTGACMYPAGRYGYDVLASGAKLNVCSIVCPHNLVCKIDGELKAFRQARFVEEKE